MHESGVGALVTEAVLETSPGQEKTMGFRNISAPRSPEGESEVFYQHSLTPESHLLPSSQNLSSAYRILLMNE